MEAKLEQSVLKEIVGSAVQKKHIYGAVFYVSNEDSSIDAISASGEIEEESRYYIASINKLFVSAIVLRLCAENKLDLQDKISNYLPDDIIGGLHRFKGTDYSNELSIVHLMSQTSGLPCYLIDKQANGKKAMSELEAGIDQSWPFDKVIQEIKKMKPHFPPGKAGYTKYIDTNHQILGQIIESFTGESIESVLKSLFQELEMSQTSVCLNIDDQSFVPIRYKSEVRHLPLFLTSTRNDIVSTARDQMKFLKAFFNGYFFPKARLGELERWRRIFFPFHYGIGIQKFSLPRILSPFKPVPEMIGHSGSTGSVAFYVPVLGIYVTGTVNQQSRPGAAFQTVIKMINRLL